LLGRHAPEAIDLAGERESVADRNERDEVDPSGDLPVRWDVGENDGTSARHRLHDGNRKAFTA
jgi:hypothetical protein